MFDRGEVLGGAQLGNKFLKVRICELVPVVDDYCLWDTEPSNDVSFIEAKGILGGNFSQCFSLYPFGEVVDGYYQKFVLIGPYHKRTEEV